MNVAEILNRFVLLRKRAKGRKDKTAAGKRRRRSAQSRRHAARQKRALLGLKGQVQPAGCRRLVLFPSFPEVI